jgi:uncharacterized membrane protein
LADELVERGIVGTVSDSRAESSNERGDAKMNNNTNDLIMVAFPTEAKAEAVGKKLLDIQPEYLIEVEGAVIATKQANGVVELNNLFRPAATGATNGASWGALIGMIVLMPRAGISLAAVAGTLGGALADTGIDDMFLRRAAQILQSGNAALFLLIRKMTTDKVVKALQGVGGRVLRTSFDRTKDGALREALAAHSMANPTS